MLKPPRAEGGRAKSNYRAGDADTAAALQGDAAVHVQEMSVGWFLGPNHAHHLNQKAMLGCFHQAEQPNHLFSCPILHVCAKYILVHLKLMFMQR